MARYGQGAFEILLVEDSQVDIRMTETALSEESLAANLNVVTDGEKALAFLRREGAYGDAPRPDLILLDLNLPRKDGREVLTELKADPLFRRIPVVVLTTSKADDDVLKAYDLHANCFITKPVEMESFVSVIKAVLNFWLNVASLPGTPQN